MEFFSRLRSSFSGHNESSQDNPTPDGDPNERSQLLPKSPSFNENHVSQYNVSAESDLNEQKSSWQLVWTELKILTNGSIPVILAYTLQMSLQTISVVIVGRSSPEDLATAAFAYMFAMVTGCIIALGGTTALDTLCSSSFTGCNDPFNLGVLLQKSFLVLGVFYIPIAIVFIFSEPLFLALGQDPRISHDSARFLWCLIPGQIGYIYFECMKKFLQAQGTSYRSYC